MEQRSRIENTAARALPQDEPDARCCGVGVSMAIPHVCTFLFLILLMVRLEYDKSMSWRLVFFPFWIGDGYTIIKRLVECKCLLIFDVCGILITKALVLSSLEGKELSALEMLCPYMAGVLCSGLAKGFLESAKNRREETSSKCGFATTFTVHVVGRGLQPILVAIKLDGIWDASTWGLVFLPSWIVLAVMASVAATLCNCTPLLSAGMQSRVRRQAIRLVALCAAQLVVVAGCLFVFGFLLAKRLDARDQLNDRVERRREECEDAKNDALCDSPGYLDRNLDSLEPTTTAILAPLIGMYLALFVLHPYVVRDSRKFQHLVQVVTSVENEEQQQYLDEAALAAQRAFDLLQQTPVEDNNIIVEALAVPTRLLQHSSTLFQRAHPPVLPPSAAPASPQDASSSTTTTTAAAAAGEDEDPAKEPQLVTSSVGSQAGDDDDDDCGSSNSGSSGDDDDDTSEYDDVVEGDDIEMQKSSKKLCYICCVEKRNAVLLECGHGGLCFGCAHSLATRPPRTCPICRVPIAAVLKVKRREEKGSRIVVAEEGITIRRM